MNPVTKIAFRRLRKNFAKNFILELSIFTSVLMISFFSFFQIQTQITYNPGYSDLPFYEFLAVVRACMLVAIGVLVAIILITIRTYCSMKNNDNAETLAILTSIGATSSQKKKLMEIEMWMLYVLPTILGTLVGVAPGVIAGNAFQGLEITSNYNYVLYAAVVVAIIVISLILIRLCYMIPNFHFKKRSVIQSVKKQNVEASETTHGYRNSATFRGKALIARLAQKSSDYYKKEYNNIALSFASSILYPVLAILLFWYVSNTNIVLDVNPYDMVDTSEAVWSVVMKMIAFIGGCFAIVTTIGIIQSIMMSKMQMANRKQAMRVYAAIGMTDQDVKKMMRQELKSVMLKVFVIVVFAALIINFCFQGVLP